ncbi:hypothetical protein A2U01_0035780 [Trifolium medium]|uniref:Uncharacterized protein n=1 Tax=Trifolium medium TaxID=97028 RepID=A0A392PRC9_9FABA|nr:hypothetical protein [Trifolium medium]
MRRPASMAAFAEEMKWGQGMAILGRRKREKGGSFLTVVVVAAAVVERVY